MIIKRMLARGCFLTLLILAMASNSYAQQDSVWMFSYFKGNGEGGLHLAYSEDGYSWTALKNDESFLKPVLSKDSLMRDPCIIRGADNRFHMVWTVSWHEPGIGYASSDDLVTWTEQQYIPVMGHESEAYNCWAPEITYDPKKKRYIIYWATTIPGRFPETATGQDHNHRMYYVSTKDFKKYSKTKLLYDQGFNVIDATLQKSGSKWVMFLKDETKSPTVEKNLRLAFSQKIDKGYSKPTAPITGNYWAEGPTVAKIDGVWHVYFDKYVNHSYGVVVSGDLENWEEKSELLTMPKGIRHGTIFKISKEELTKLPK